MTILSLSGTELRRRLNEGLDIPDWFSFEEVVKQLRASHPPRAQQGATLLFTGLSGSGKSTIANAVRTKLMEMGGGLSHYLMAILCAKICLLNWAFPKSTVI